MSSMFSQLTVPELKKVAEDFAVDLPAGTPSKKTIIEHIENDGVTYQMYKAQLVPAADAEPDLAEVNESELDDGPYERELDEEEPSTVIKMTRKNNSYEIRGYRFTQQHPYAVVSDDDAEYLIEFGKGFRPASKKEILEFYGQR